MRFSAWHLISCRRVSHSTALRLSRRANNGWQLDTRLDKLSSRAPLRAFGGHGSGLYSDPTFFSSDLDTGFLSSTQTKEAILERARAHGIDTLERLDFEAELSPVRSQGQRLLDDRATRQDLDLWAIILDYRSMKDGSSGVEAVLRAMLHGNEPVKLRADSVSNHIWRLVLPVVLADRKLLYQLSQVGSSFLRERPSVFADVVGQLLATGNLRSATVAATQLFISHFRGYSDLLYLFDIVVQQDDTTILRQFCQLISRLPRHRIYDATITKLWTLGRNKHAFLLHQHLLSLDDFPTDFRLIEPFVHYIAQNNLPLEPFLDDLEMHGISYSYQSRQFYGMERARLAQKTGRSPMSSFHSGPGTRPVKLSDVFVARTFATRSVSFDFVLNGLRFVGLFEIGPLAVRELALAAKSNEELKRRFRQLDSMEVDLGSSNYVRLVKNLCLVNEERILQLVLNSDMHHEVYEDTSKQKRLLAEYYHALDWQDVDRTLATLSGGQVGDKIESRSAQFLLQTTLIEGDWRGALINLDVQREAAQGRNTSLVLSPLRLAIQRVWSSVRSQEQKNIDYLQRRQYLVGLMQLAQGTGHDVHPWQWRSILHAVAHARNWDMFRDLLTCLVRLYHGQGVGEADRGQVLDEFFDGPMLAFVLEVSLNTEAEGSCSKAVWTRGVELLRDLRQQFHIKVDFDNISAALKTRLQELFHGEDAGTQRRLIGHYLRCLGWAWVEVVSQLEGKHPRAVEQRGVCAPDHITLQLFQVRSRSVSQRRLPVRSDRVLKINEAISAYDQWGFANAEDVENRE